MDQSGHVFLVLLCQIGQVDRRRDDEGPQWPYLFMSFNTKLIDVAIVEQLIQMFKVLDVSCEMVQKHNVQENPQHLRERRVSLICGFFLTFSISAADADRENLLRPQPDHRAERLLQARTTIAEEGGPTRGFEFYR